MSQEPYTVKVEAKIPFLLSEWDGKTRSPGGKKQNDHPITWRNGGIYSYFLPVALHRPGPRRARGAQRAALAGG